MDNQIVERCYLSTMRYKNEYEISDQNKRIYCIQSVYYSKIIDELKSNIMKYFYFKRTEHLRKQEYYTSKPIEKHKFIIGIIGYGDLGSNMYDMLVNTFAEFDVIVSSRRLNNNLSNVDLIKRSDLIFLCILPNQFQFLLNEINSGGMRKYLNRKIFVSFIAGVNNFKLHNQLSKLSFRSEIINNYKITINEMNRNFIDSFCAPNIRLIEVIYNVILTLLIEFYQINKELALYITIKILFDTKINMEEISKMLIIHEKKQIFDKKIIYFNLLKKLLKDTDNIDKKFKKKFNSIISSSISNSK